MKAKFIGRHGSMGLHHGETYNITITEDKKFIWVKWKPRGILEAASQILGYSPCRCPYSNEVKLRENWKILG